MTTPEVYRLRDAAIAERMTANVDQSNRLTGFILALELVLGLPSRVDTERIAHAFVDRYGRVRGMSDKITGVLEVGTNGNGEVVINHPDLQPDENGVGHIVFSPQQARNLARLLNDHANKAENAACPFDVGDKVVVLSGPERYREYIGVGTVVRIGHNRVVVQWANGGRTRNHAASNLKLAEMPL